MLTKENLTTGFVAGVVAALTLLLVSWAVMTIRYRLSQSTKQPCGCGGH
ncbi:hypothetical protein [Fibrella forsythiae]|uniref:FeoB-associated Cys-rich membrane protein n=1 Tax=Fibrella forsythiae TaxID=2817061 RepID=A0ABS3JAH1_9BACT|nr:hypothetical protein [Fibrella forsythiae]MBO0947000.1 hypothetical protein [Fibrella forsythiae]